MLGDMAVALVISVAWAMGVGGAAWLLMFRPLGQAPVNTAVRHVESSINWASRN